MSNTRMGSATVFCPHCKARAKVIDSRPVLPTAREARAACQNHECGHTFVVQIVAVRTICPSNRPDPNIDLPVARPRSTKKNGEPPGSRAAA